MNGLILRLSICFAVIVFAVFNNLLDDSKKQAVRRRIDALTTSSDSETTVSQVFKERKKKKKKKVLVISKHFEDNLAMSGVKLSGQEYINIWACCTIGPAIFGSLLGLQPVSVIGLCLIGLALPPVMVQRSRNKQRQMFNQQLGDALTIMSNCMRSGYSFQQAMNSIASEMPAPISTEFARVVRELNYGVQMGEALDHMLRRVQSKDMELLVSAVLTSMEVGANLSEILDTISETVRDRIRLREEVRTLSAQGRASGLLIGVLPLVVGLLLMVVNPTYFTEFFATSTGRTMVLVGIVMEACGFFVINRIVDIKY